MWPDEEDERRLWARVALPDADGHMLWLGGVNQGGYGQLSVAGQMHGAHRVVQTLLVGTIPDGMEVDHRCAIKRCVSVAHLEVVTPAENQRRRNERNGWRSRAK